MGRWPPAGNPSAALRPSRRPAPAGRTPWSRGNARLRPRGPRAETYLPRRRSRVPNQRPHHRPARRLRGPRVRSPARTYHREGGREAAGSPTRAFAKPGRTRAALAGPEAPHKGTVPWSHSQVPPREAGRDRRSAPRRPVGLVSRPRGRPHGNRVRRRLANVPLCGAGGRGGCAGRCLENPGTHSSKMGLLSLLPPRPRSKGHLFLVDVGATGVDCLTQNLAGSPRDETRPEFVGFRPSLPVTRPPAPPRVLPAGKLRPGPLGASQGARAGLLESNARPGGLPGCLLLDSEEKLRVARGVYWVRSRCAGRTPGSPVPTTPPCVVPEPKSAGPARHGPMETCGPRVSFRIFW